MDGRVSRIRTRNRDAAKQQTRMRDARHTLLPGHRRQTRMLGMDLRRSVGVRGGTMRTIGMGNVASMNMMRL